MTMYQSRIHECEEEKTQLKLEIDTLKQSLDN
jgi:hypothetical protein